MRRRPRCPVRQSPHVTAWLAPPSRAPSIMTGYRDAHGSHHGRCRRRRTRRGPGGARDTRPQRHDQLASARGRPPLCTGRLRRGSRHRRHTRRGAARTHCPWRHHDGISAEPGTTHPAVARRHRRPSDSRPWRGNPTPGSVRMACRKRREQSTARAASRESAKLDASARRRPR